MNLSRTALELLEQEDPHTGYVIARLFSRDPSTIALGLRLFDGDYVECGVGENYFQVIASLLSESR